MADDAVVDFLAEFRDRIGDRHCSQVAFDPVSDGDGSLLDHMTILYGSGISNSQRHSGDNLPLIVVGGANGKLSGGQHLKYENRPSHANLLATLMDKMDVPVDKVGGSTDKLSIESLPGL